MVMTDFLVGFDGTGALLLSGIGFWLVSSAIHGWRQSGYSAEIDLLLGFGLGLIAHGLNLVLSMIRRQLGMAGQPAWWFFDSWPYAGTKLLALAAGIIAVRGLTRRRWGEWPWIAVLFLVLIGAVWTAPANMLGTWLHGLIEHLH